MKKTPFSVTFKKMVLLLPRGGYRWSNRMELNQVRIWANWLLEKSTASMIPHLGCIRTRNNVIQSDLHFTINYVFIDIYLCSSIRDCILNYS